MQYMRRNRIIGIMVVAFASLLVVPALLSHTDEDLAKLKVTSANTKSVPVPVGVASNVPPAKTAQNANVDAKRLPQLPLPSVTKSGDAQQNTQSQSSTKKPAFELASLDSEDLPKSVDSQKSVALPKPVAQKQTAQKVSKSTQRIDVASAKKAPAKPAKANNKKSITKGQTVQVASLTNKGNAEKLQKNLQKNGIPAFIKHVIVDKKQYTRVMIGPFDNEKALTQAKAKMSKLGY